MTGSDIRAGFKGFLAGLDRIPQILINNPQVRHVPYDPIGFRVEPGDAFAGLRILEVMQPVPLVNSLTLQQQNPLRTVLKRCARGGDHDLALYDQHI